MENKFNLALATTTEKAKVGKNTFEVWKGVYVDEKGQAHEVVLRDEKAVANASRIDALLSMKEFSLLGLCYELSECNPKDFGLKRVGEVAEHYFHIKAGTANGYARVGKHFVKKLEDSEKGVKYKLVDEVEGATVTNLVQCLSLINEDSDEPLGDFYKAIYPDENGKVAINLNSTLADLKKQLKAYKNGETTDGVIADVEAKEILSEPIKTDLASVFKTLLEEVDKIDGMEKKAHALDLVAELQEIFS